MKKNTLIKRIIIILVTATVGLVILNINGNSQLRCTEPVTGVLVGYDEVVKNDNSTKYFPIFLYSYSGNQYEEVAPTGLDTKEYTDGEQVELLLNPRNPNEYNIVGANELAVVGWICLGVAIFMLMGLVFNVLGIGTAMTTGEAGVGTAAVMNFFDKLSKKKDTNHPN